MTFGVSGLTLRFGDATVLDDIDLELPTGEIVALVGGDGAGKTSLLRCLVGQYRPSTGAVRRPERRDVGYMPATSGTWRDLTVDENVEFVTQAYAMDDERRRHRRDELLERADLAEASDRLARDLSGGMRQKLGFVMASIHEPKLLVLDEPSTGVDPVSRLELWRLIAESATAGAAVVMATSYLDEAERASSITVLDGGRVLAMGTRDELVASMPGVVTAPDRPTEHERSWRRGDAVREWRPSPVGSNATPLGPADLELEDAVIARMLARRAEPTDTRTGVAS